MRQPYTKIQQLSFCPFKCIYLNKIFVRTSVSCWVKKKKKRKKETQPKKHLISHSKNHYPDSMIIPRTESLKLIQTAEDKEEALLQTIN